MSKSGGRLWILPVVSRTQASVFFRGGARRIHTVSSVNFKAEMRIREVVCYLHNELLLDWSAIGIRRDQL